MIERFYHIRRPIHQKKAIDFLSPNRDNPRIYYVWIEEIN